ncbi:MAG: type II secretion system protein N [Pseudomonadota bacterium]
MNKLLSTSMLPTVCYWLLIVGIAWTLASTAFALILGPTVELQPAAQRQAVNRKPARTNINVIRNKHLFGKATANTTAAPAQEKVTVTKLPLELLGVFVAERPEDSAAIVAQKNKQGLLYGIGEKVPGNATLEEVFSDRIIISRLGKREELSFDEASNGIVADRSSRTPVKPLQRTRRGLAPGQPGGTGESELAPASGGNSVADRNPRTPREFLEAYSDRLSNDPEGLLQELGVQPVAAGGSEGYRLGNLASTPQLSQFGLQSGDVILSVNGQSVGNVRQDTGRLGGLLTQGSARLEVQRGSRRFYVTASLK